MAGPADWMLKQVQYDVLSLIVIRRQDLRIHARWRDGPGRKSASGEGSESFPLDGGRLGRGDLSTVMLAKASIQPSAPTSGFPPAQDGNLPLVVVFQKSTKKEH
jgi:hypothetical protein